MTDEHGSDHQAAGHRGSRVPPCRGKRPVTGERQLEVLFRNGCTSKFTYTAAQLRWSIENHPFDVVGYR